MTQRSEASQNPLCGLVNEAVTAFLGGRGEGIRDRQVRKHLEACEACRTRYEEAVETIAHVGRARRQSQEADLARAARIAKRKKKNTAGEAEEAARRGRGHKLRLMLLPAAAILIATQLGRIGNKSSIEMRPVVTGVEGEVQVSGKALVDTDGPIALFRGQRCGTGVDGTAKLGTGKVTLTLGPRTSVMIESSSRFRLEQGTVAFEGTCAITTSLGVLAVEEGQGTLELDGSRVLASVAKGSLTWVDPSGVQPLAVGAERIVAYREDSVPGS